ncbi:hypothetical protein M9Y10_012374 [Tritrichomonas musculus]|uniref:Histone acetyltransferase n=2 Tax=Tritrichomonas musculus TaxID=1915356 RepID=A0ABR2ICB7_9EUKA
MDEFKAGFDSSNLKQGDVVLYKSPNSMESIRAQIINIFESGQCYIHFIGYNRRYDLTVDRSALTFVEHAPNAANGPPHRGRRKKHSELELRLWTIDEIQKYEVQCIRNIEVIEFKEYFIRAWYPSPYPVEYINNRKIFICDTCLKYFSSRTHLNLHLAKPHKHSFPPGYEIYRDSIDENTQISVFEIEGAKNTMFCQCLCLLGRLFLEDKAVFYDVTQFTFYVMAKYEFKLDLDTNSSNPNDSNNNSNQNSNEIKMSIVGFYSLDKYTSDNIIACIVVFPQYQRDGFGKTLISLAYTIAKRKNIRGGPESPLSDLGSIAFKSYWRDSILDFIHNYGTDDTDSDRISEATFISHADVHETLKGLDLLIKVQKGRPATIDRQGAEILYEQYKRQMHFINEENLIWLPHQTKQKKHPTE